MWRLATLGLLLLGLPRARAADDYRPIVLKFADTLLAQGRDAYGPRVTPVWMSVLDTRHLTAPADAKAVPAPKGIRESDRAVGGANLYHDVVTIKVFDALTELTGDARYRRAVDDYLRFYLSAARHPRTGLLAWGEHLYYQAYEDRVERRWHELLGWTPPWERLFEIDPRAAERAIAGIYQWHFFDQEKFLFNRHADYLGEQLPDPGKSQPWIKHSGLYAYSFAVAHAKTRNRRYLDWARGIGSLYWNARNPATNLTESCLGDPRPTSRLASPGGAGMLAYWLYKAGELLPPDSGLRDRALILMKAFDRYGYDASAGGYLNAVRTDGTRPGPGARVANVWDFAYGGEGAVIQFGRAAAYLAARSGDAEMTAIARRAARMVISAPRPAEGDIGTLGDALNLTLDLHDLTGETVYLKQARAFAREVVEKFWRGGLFRSHTGYEYYEANLGVGDAVQGLLRLSLKDRPPPKGTPRFDWSR